MEVPAEQEPASPMTLRGVESVHSRAFVLSEDESGVGAGLLGTESERLQPPPGVPLPPSPHTAFSARNKSRKGY